MNKIYKNGFLLVAALQVSTNAFAAKLNVPQDFPNSFHMDLLSGSVIVDSESGAAAPGELDVIPTGGVSQILFDATEFDGSGVIGEGVSSLTLTSNHVELATFEFSNLAGSFYLDGQGAGTLVDNGNGTGEWIMNLPLYAEWAGNIFNFSDITLSTNATYNYNILSYDAFGNYRSTSQAISGVSMDYETGDAFLVGQSIITDPNHPWRGLRITLGMYGNDPVLATPVPAAVWLFVSGLIGLYGLSRRKQSD